MPARLTREEFIDRSVLVHGKKYNYDKVVYYNGEKKVDIFCSLHGAFPISPYQHLRGRGCKKCGFLKRSWRMTLSTSDFIKRARGIHGDRYDYNQVVYEHNRKKIKIVCGVHGIFEQSPFSHIQGAGCPQCAKKQNKFSWLKRKRNLGITIKDLTVRFIDRATKIHGDRYGYSKFEYVDMVTKSCIYCQDHGYFWQSPVNHLNKEGCPSCKCKKQFEVGKVLFKYFCDWDIKKHKCVWTTFRDYRHRRFCDFG